MSNLPKGASFLFQTTDPQSIFTCEDFTEEHRMIATTCSRFIEEKVFGQMEDLEHKKEGLMREVLMAAGELGLLGADVPEEYGGMALDEISSTIIAEKVGYTGAFGVTHGGQVGIGSLPIVYFGNTDQKAKYLPELVTGEKVAAYALTEPGSGSDALSAKTKAILSDDGKYYVLNGAKQFITNAGMADVFIVYAKIDGEKFTAFIVDGNSEGLTTGAEEKKMGLKGSSTRCVYFDDVKVPVENMLFEPGRGHVVAFNILNIGRHKVGTNGLGSAKLAIDLSASYANERKQFKVPIAEFGMMKEKLAEMTTRTYAAESMIYRTGGMLNDNLHGIDLMADNCGQEAGKRIEEYVVECSLGKVFATEVQAYVVDEGVQIHGGYGFVSEYAIERLYRDARITRIFEGTNEINRNLIPTTLIRRATKGDVPLKDGIAALKGRMGDVAERKSVDDLVQAAKDATLYMIGAAIDKFGDSVLKQQEVLGRLADMLIYTYGMDSALARAKKSAAAGASTAGHKMNMATLFGYTSIVKLAMTAKEICAALASGDALVSMMADVDKLTKHMPVDIIALRREIAAQVSAAGKYVV
jgi:alkylation response protein AidB-like acyl-CoA dehydrogenase